MDNLNLGGMPDWDALATEIAAERCGLCGSQATTRCAGVHGAGTCVVVMYMCDSCRVNLMNVIASGGLVDYDAVVYRQRGMN